VRREIKINHHIPTFALAAPPSGVRAEVDVAQKRGGKHKSASKSAAADSWILNFIVSTKQRKLKIENHYEKNHAIAKFN
jgi:hypothetical protein